MKRKSGIWKKGAAAVVASAVIAVSIPVSGLAVGASAQAEGAQIQAAGQSVAYFDFNQEAADGKFTGGSAVASVRGSVSLQERDEENGKALYLDGSEGNYLEVKKADGSSLLTGMEELTISYDAKPERTGTNWAFYAAPNANKQANGKERYIGAFSNNEKTKVERYNNNGSRPAAALASTGTGWAHVDVVFSGDFTAVYVDGLKQASVGSSYALLDILGEKSIFQIGKANWENGEYYQGWIDNVQIYNTALTDADLVSDETVTAAVNEDADAIGLASFVNQDFSLPSKGLKGSDITWEVPANDYLRIENQAAIVTRPTGKDETVTMKATVSMNSGSGNKIEAVRAFDVTVQRALDDAGIVRAAKEQLAIAQAGDIRGNITLPTELQVDGADVKAAITWKSGNQQVITDQEQEGKPAGVVNRQKQDTKVKLTAILSVGNESAEKEIEVTVRAAFPQSKTTDYLFAFFVNNGGPSEQQIFFASSRDGDNWMDLNRKEAVLSVADSVRSQEDIEKTRNQAGVRDPYLIRSPEGDKFFLIATDLCIGSEDIANGTVGWGTSQYNGSHCLRIWESNDLVNWSEPWLADVAPEGTTCAWAPEAVYDETTGEYVVFWASMTGSVQKVYYSKTRDFRTFTEPVKMVDNGKDHIIDTTILKAEDGTYYRGSAASGTIKMEKCTDNTDWLSLDAWTGQGYIKDLTGFTAGLEGPELYKYNEDDYKEVNGKKATTYGLLADNFGGVGYVPFYTTDISQAKWVKNADSSFNFDTLHKRHGTILTLTAEEYDRVMEAYGPSAISVKRKPVKTVYRVGDEKLNPSGLVLTVTYKNGKTEDIAYPEAGSKNIRQFTFTGDDFSSKGEKTITVAYRKQTASFHVTAEDGEMPVPELLADFNFDSEEDGFTGGAATAVGTYDLQDSYDGKALYLDGSGYLTVTDREGGSLLSGVSELTISYEMKPDRTATNWVLYAAPGNDTQLYQKEKYLGIMENSGNTTLERYENAGTRPVNPTAKTGSDWYHVDIVVTKKDTAIYVNGKEQSRAASDIPLENILGETGILYIGRANWGGGEYFKGWIDNFKIFSKAYDQEHLPDVSDSYARLLLGQTADAITDFTFDSASRKLPDYSGMVTWKSNTSNVVIAEDGLSAKITQPETGEAPLAGTLTAVLAFGGVQIEKTIQISIQPKVDAGAAYGYLMVHFIEDSAGYAEKIYLDISRGDSPEQWDPLNGGDPILASSLGTTGVRDPYLTYNPQTQTYYIIATDLRVFGGDDLGWGAWQKSYSTKMNVWESKDLITWSDVRQFDAALNEEGKKQAELGMMWAPEATWVPDYYGEGKGAFVVYWSSKLYKNTDPGHDENVNSKIMWGATTDFTQETYEYGGVFLENSTQGYIDTTMIQNENKTYHITKYTADDSIVMQSTEDKEWWKPGTKWTTIQREIGKGRFGSVEGPAVFKNHSRENSWYLFVDDLPQPGYQPMASDDLDKGWDYLSSPDYFLTNNTKHGGVISLTKRQYDAVRAADAVSAVSEDLGTVTVKQGQKKEEVQQILPKAQVNTAYDAGAAELPAVWDLSEVNLDQAGTYQIKGIVQSIGANKNQWAGKNGSTAYNAPDRQLYSSKAIAVTAEIVVTEVVDPAVKEIEAAIQALNVTDSMTKEEKAEIIALYERYLSLTVQQKSEIRQELKDKLEAAYQKATEPAVTPPSGDGTTDPKPVTPLGQVAGLKLSPSSSAVKLTWNALPGAAGYQVYRYDKAKKNFMPVKTVKTTSYTEKGKKPGTAYQYKVCAYKMENGKAVYGTASSAKKILTKPAAATKVNGKRASLSFKKASGATEYQICKYNAKTRKYTLAYRVKGGRLYQYHVKTKKYKKINKVKVKKGMITCTLTKLDLKAEKKQKYRVRAAAAKSGYAAQYSKYSRTVTIK